MEKVGWTFPFGPDVFPKHFPDTASELDLASLTDIPTWVYGVYWPDPQTKKWKFFIPGVVVPLGQRLEKLLPGEDYRVAVGEAGTWTIVGSQSQIEDIRSENLVISPTQVKVGDSVGVSITARNYGGVAGSKTVTCTMGEHTMQTTVELAPGESRQVSFEVTPTVVKTYSVSVDGLRGSFTAFLPPPPPPPPPLLLHLPVVWQAFMCL